MCEEVRIGSRNQPLHFGSISVSHATIGMSPSGKALGSGSSIRGFESLHPSHNKNGPRDCFYYGLEELSSHCGLEFCKIYFSSSLYPLYVIRPTFMKGVLRDGARCIAIKPV